MQRFRLISPDGQEAVISHNGSVFPYMRMAALARLNNFSVYRIECEKEADSDK